MTQSRTTTTVRHQVLVNAPIGEAFKVLREERCISERVGRLKRSPLWYATSPAIPRGHSPSSPATMRPNFCLGLTRSHRRE